MDEPAVAMPVQPEAHQPDRLGFWIALAVIPAGWPFLGNWLIWNIWGDDGFIPSSSSGGEILGFWTGGGLGLTAGLLSFTVLLARGWTSRRALGFAAVSVALAYATVFVVTLTWIALDPGALS